ncbi:hypothetical protein TB1_012866 [Malus domestica]
MLKTTTSIVSQPNSQGNGDLEATPQSFTHQPSQHVRMNPPRERKALAKFVDYVTYASRHPISEAISNHSFSKSHVVFLTAVSNLVEPNTFQEANLIPYWRKDMSEELQALEENYTWSIIQLHPGKKAIGSCWVYKTQLKAEGSIERHKARLIACGFTQIFGIDYKKNLRSNGKNEQSACATFSCRHLWLVVIPDGCYAFLHGELQEEVYMKIPLGYSPVKDGMVCKLHKAIYGLKQSPRAWYAKLSSVLEREGFLISNVDSSLFLQNGTRGKLVVLIYVDDLIITCDNLFEIGALKTSLHQTFAIKDLGKLKYFHGIEMASSQRGLFLNQHKYVMDLLEEA